MIKFNKSVVIRNAQLTKGEEMVALNSVFCASGGMVAACAATGATATIGKVMVVAGAVGFMGSIGKALVRGLTMGYDASALQDTLNK